MIADTQYLFVVIALLTAAVIIVTTFRTIKISPVLGYFVAGAILGKYGLALIPAGKGLDVFAEFGVVFLLFVIGLELTIDRLMTMRNYIFGFGSLQIFITGSVLMAIFHFLFKIPLKGSIIIGGGLALSSTAIVIQVLVERSLISTQVGRLSIGTLLMQDFAVVPLLVLLPMFDETSHKDSSITYSIFIAMGKGLIAFCIIFFSGRLLLKPFFRVIGESKSSELFIAATLLIALGAAYITETFDLSMALGAFLAGLMVAETEYADDVENAILPFKDLLLGLFFMTVGMSIDFHLLLKHIVQILSYTAIIITIKALIIYSLARLFKFNNRSAIQSGLLLAQASEFAFILFGLADEHNIIDTNLSQIMMMTTTFTMALTPLLAILGERVTAEESSDFIDPNKYIVQETSDLVDHVIIVGFGKTGRVLANILISEYVYYVIVDISSANIIAAQKDGYVAYKGDATKIDIFEKVRISDASNIVITVPNLITAAKIAEIIRNYYPDIPIIAKSYNLDDTSDLIASGVNHLIPENYEISIVLAGTIMANLGFSDSEISSSRERLRSFNYKLIREDPLNIEKK